MERWCLLCLMLCHALLLAACSNGPELRSARAMQAAEFNQRGEQAFHHGDYQRASALYERALQLDRAIEHEDGIAINTLNLARAEQMLGQTAQAEYLLDILLNDKALNFAPAFVADGAVQKALLRLRAGDAEKAAFWLDYSESRCGADCKLSGVIANVRGAIALHLNDGAQALFWGERATAANRDSPLEYANALRLQAAGRLMLKEPDAAMLMAGQALLIDKAQGLPEKIRHDLELQAQAQEQLGHAELAAQYRERAGRILATGLK